VSDSSPFFMLYSTYHPSFSLEADLEYICMEISLTIAHERQGNHCSDVML